MVSFISKLNPIYNGSVRTAYASDQQVCTCPASVHVPSKYARVPQVTMHVPSWYACAQQVHVHVPSWYACAQLGTCPACDRTDLSKLDRKCLEISSRH